MSDDSHDKALQNLRILGIQAAVSPTYQNLLDKIRRWYSREFSTPLKEVETYDTHYVLRHYFEDKYIQDKERDPTTFSNELEELFFPERKEAIDDWVAELEREVAEQDRKEKENQQVSAEKPPKHNLSIPKDLELPDFGNLGE